MKPTLVLCAHGTNDPSGQATVLEIAAAVAARLTCLRVEVAYVDVQQPELGPVVDSLVAAGESVVVVPVLLTLGHHTEVDVAEVVARHRGRVTSTGPLGPHPLLEAALVDRLREAGVTEGSPVVVGFAGSSRAAAADVGRGVAARVAELWSGPVTVGFLAAAEPSVAQAVAAAGGDTPVAVASYLIGHGFFQRKLAAAGGNLLTEPLGAHPALVEVAIERYRFGAARLAGGDPTAPGAVDSVAKTAAA